MDAWMDGWMDDKHMETEEHGYGRPRKWYENGVAGPFPGL
jgi:hypothetical protein